ncbi:PP2C family protein-serine/threonine phosphatase [Microbacterium sp. P01]|uniref:PP2C family protein-serine/threonine phosphatase n=1 Tax=unclassified Microbacterium TaxID=2609290 RepID=UPI00366AECA8
MGGVDAVDLAFGVTTDVGLRRKVNEDSALVVRPAFVVADGMGGYEAGDLASRAVVDAFRDHVCTGEPVRLVDVSDALAEAERRVTTIAAATRRGAGSTLTGVVLLEYEGRPHWLVVNVGDSRVYRHFGAELEQLTIDHSLAQELMDAGQLTEQERRTFDERNVITRAIGAPDARADSWLMPVTNGERLLVCSDGLHGELMDEQIRAILTMSGRPAAAASALVDAAKRTGGRDNITAIVVDVRSGGTDPAGDSSMSSSLIGSRREDTGADTTVDRAGTVPR